MVKGRNANTTFDSRTFEFMNCWHTHAMKGFYHEQTLLPCDALSSIKPKRAPHSWWEFFNFFLISSPCELWELLKQFAKRNDFIWLCESWQRKSTNREVSPSGFEILRRQRTEIASLVGTEQQNREMKGSFERQNFKCKLSLWYFVLIDKTNKIDKFSRKKQREIYVLSNGISKCWSGLSRQSP